MVSVAEAVACLRAAVKSWRRMFVCEGKQKAVMSSMRHVEGVKGMVSLVWMRGALLAAAWSRFLLCPVLCPVLPDPVLKLTMPPCVVPDFLSSGRRKGLRTVGTMEVKNRNGGDEVVRCCSSFYCSRSAGRNFFDAALLGDDIHACHCLFPRVELKVPTCTLPVRSTDTSPLRSPTTRRLDCHRPPPPPRRRTVPSPTQETFLCRTSAARDTRGTSSKQRGGRLMTADAAEGIPPPTTIGLDQQDMAHVRRRCAERLVRVARSWHDR